MKRLNAALLALLLASPAPAELLSLRFDGVAAPAGFQKTAVRPERGPGYEAPDEPPNLTEQQKLRFLEAVTLGKGDTPLPPGLDHALLLRALVLLDNFDRHFQRPITGSEWEQKLGEAARKFNEKHPRGSLYTRDAWDGAINGMLKELVGGFKDPHSAFLNQREYTAIREANMGMLAGIGSHVRKHERGAELTLVFPGSPADKAGLLDGDVVLAIDGKPIAQLKLDEQVGLIRGRPGSVVRLRVLRGAEEGEFTVTRGFVSIPTVVALMAAPGIGYVRLETFNDKAYGNVVEAIERVRKDGATKLVLDLRGNPGGLVRAVDLISSEFLKDGDLIRETRRQGKMAERAWTLGDGKFRGLPLVVLVNGGSASASEIFAAAVQDHDAGVVVGERTFGKGTFQTVMPINIPQNFFVTKPDGTGAKITDGGWYSPKGRSIEGQWDEEKRGNKPGSGGVVPDVAVEVPEDDEKEVADALSRVLVRKGTFSPKDRALRKALELLGAPAS